MRLRFSLRGKLFLVITISILVAVVLITTYSYQKSSIVIEQQGITWSINALNQAEESIRSRVEAIHNLFNSALTNPYFSRLLSTENDKDVGIDPLILQQIESIARSYESYSQIERMRVYVRNSPSDSDRRAIRSLISFKNSKQYTELIESQQQIYFTESYLYKNSAGVDVPVVSALMAIKTLDNFDELGLVIELVIKEEYFTIVLDSLSEEVEAQSFLLNKNSEVGLQSTTSTVGEGMLVRSLATSSEVKEWQKLTIADEPYYLGRRNVRNTQWDLYFFMKELEISALSRNLRNEILIVVAICLAVMVFITAFLSQLITRRLEHLRHAMQLVQKGNFAVTLSIGGNDEVSDLQKDFVFMISQIQSLVKEKEITVEHLRTQELNALHSQINPHFLYNSLDLINWMAFEHGAKEIQQTVSDLARLYKISLSNGETLIPLKQELTHVTMYMNIQNTRYDNAIIFETNCPKELENYLIPKITLQPIVENAIMHGIMKTAHKEGRISISVTMEKDKLIFLVEDTGVGLTKEVLEKSLNIKDKDGYGLSNVHTRLQMYFGTNYGISFGENNTNTSIQIAIKPILTYDELKYS